MNTKEIKELLKLVSELELREVRIKQKDFELKIRTDKDVTTQVISGAPMIAQAPANAPAPAPIAAATTADSGATSDAGATETSEYIEIKSPMVGTFYRSASPDKPAYKQVGDQVAKGDVVCIIEAMKLFNEIESEVTGKIVKVLVDDSTPVEYDQVLFLIDPGA